MLLDRPLSKYFRYSVKDSTASGESRVRLPSSSINEPPAEKKYGIQFCQEPTPLTGREKPHLVLSSPW